METNVAIKEDDGTNDISKSGEDDESIDEIEDDENREIKYDNTPQCPRIGKTKKLMNQFNFCERATITHQNSLKVSSIIFRLPTS